MDLIDKIANFMDNFDYVFIGAFAVIVLIAIIRSIKKVSRGERVDVSPVGIVNDLPSSVTGVSKHLDDEEYIKFGDDEKSSQKK